MARALIRSAGTIFGHPGRIFTTSVKPSPTIENFCKSGPSTHSKFHTSSCRLLDAQQKASGSGSEEEMSKSGKLKDSISQTYVPLEDQQRIIQDVIDEIWNPLPEPETPMYQPPAEYLQRGTTGVFDLPELVKLLKTENAFEIVTIALPKEIDYADLMIIVTTKSPRHLQALATYVRKRYKMKNLKRSDTLPVITNKDDKYAGWVALDLGNIILHLFLQNQRDHYDLEMLWTVGSMFDDLCNSKDPDVIQLLNMIK